MMRFLSLQIVFSEIPDEISLAILVTGCPKRCPGCHSSDAWKNERGTELNSSVMQALLKKYEKWISTVLFMGGEWHETELIALLDLIRKSGFKTALYTGEESISEVLEAKLDFLKTGPYIQELGGLQSPLTNQILKNLNTGEILNLKLQKSTLKEYSK